MREYWGEKGLLPLRRKSVNSTNPIIFPEATCKALTRDGWIKTGDLGMLDAEGFLYVRDRSESLSALTVSSYSK